MIFELQTMHIKFGFDVEVQEEQRRHCRTTPENQGEEAYGVGAD
jgi:hypothetical protein